jgi:ABC-type lipoprotein export system ATPase subunit
MELLAGTLREPYHGSLQVLGVELRELRRDAERQRHLRRVGLIPQDVGLLPGSGVGDILHQDLTDAQVPAADHEARVCAALDRVGMLPFAARNSEQLSGGQRQRVAIARTLARDVDLIVADEPTANLDPAQAESIMALFEELGTARPVIIVTHDMGLAARCARIVVLRPLVGAPQAMSPSAGGLDPAVPRRHGVAAAGGMLVLALATAGSTLAVRATNAHLTAHPPAVAARSAAGVPVATTAGPATPPPARTPVATPGAGRELTSPASPATPPAPALQVVQVVNRTPPGGPTPIAPLPGAAPVLPGPSNAPAPAPALPPAPPPAAAAPYLQIAGQPFPVCTGGDCQGSFVHDSDWSPGVPSYYDAGGSIIGNRHGLDPGVEVDLWSGTSTTRYQVLGSVTVENWGRPGPTTPPPGTALQLGGIDQANVCSDSRCTAPYFTTYVFLGALG